MNISNDGRFMGKKIKEELCQLIIDMVEVYHYITLYSFIVILYFMVIDLALDLQSSEPLLLQCILIIYKLKL